MTRLSSPRTGDGRPSADDEFSVGVPIRRTRWTSFWVGLAAVFLSLPIAAALAALLLLWPSTIDGAWVLLAFNACWFILFFLSLPLQKRYARSFDLRRPGARLAGGMLTFPLTDGTLLSFDLEEPYDLLFGWNEVLSRNTGGPTTNSRGLMTYTILSQAGRVLFLQAEDSVREAQSAGWPNSTSASTPELRLRLWASDLVTLVEAVRLHPRPAVAEASPRKRHVTSQT